MITLDSKSSHQFVLPGGAPAGLLHPGDQYLVETGIAQFTFNGGFGWKRDTLVIPVGVAGTAADLIAGIASAAPAAWESLASGEGQPPTSESVSVSVFGTTSDGKSVTSTGTITVPLPATSQPSPAALSVDAVGVAWSAALGQPAITASLAVLGAGMAFQALSYTVHLHLRTHEGSIVVGGGGGGRLP